VKQLRLDVDYQVVTMEGWQPAAAPGFGWPLGERAWVSPSPNAPNLSMARCYPGTVMLEGTTLSEGRGTTRPLELFGAPDLEPRRLLGEMQALAPEWMQGCRLRECWFEPTFHKHAGKLCAGMQIHVDEPGYRHAAFRPWRLLALAFPPTWMVNGVRSALLGVGYFFGEWYLDLAVLWGFLLIAPLLGFWVFSGMERNIRRREGVGEY